MACAACPGDNTSLALRDELSTHFTDDDCTALYRTRGRPAVAPWRLALVTAFPVIESLSDWKVADAVRARIDRTSTSRP